MKLYFYITIIFTCLYSSIEAQITGGSGGEIETNTHSKKVKKERKNPGYIIVSYSNPIGKLGGYSDDFKDESDIEGNVKEGVGCTFGKTYFLNRVMLPENFQLGIEAMFFNVHYLWGDHHDYYSSSDDGYYDYSEDYQDYFFTAGIGAGLTLSYKVANKLHVDAKFVLQPSYYTWDVLTDDSDDEYYFNGIKVRKSFGLYARYGRLILGMDWSWGTIKSQSYQDLEDANLGTGIRSLSIGFTY